MKTALSLNEVFVRFTFSFESNVETAVYSKSRCHVSFF